MTKNTEPRLNLPKKPFLTDQEIEEQFKPFTANLKDSEGKTHEITAPLYIWDWFLMLTWVGHTPSPFLDDVLDWQNENLDKQTLSESFSIYITELRRLGEPKRGEQVSINHDRFLEYVESDTHPHYDELVDLQWRFDDKVKYPMAPSAFLPDPKILYK